MSQNITVTEVGYAFAAIPAGLGAVPLLADDYATIVNEALHGTQAGAFALGPSVLPSKAAPRADTAWAHTECTPMDGPLNAQWTLNFRAAGGAVTFTSPSPVATHAVGGSFVDTWPLTLNVAGTPLTLGTAWVKYKVTFLIVGGSLCK
jgi:hypothetical protein